MKSHSAKSLPLGNDELDRVTSNGTVISSEEEFFRGYIWQEVRRACTELPPKYRNIAIEHYIKGMKTSEIAQKYDLEAEVLYKDYPCPIVDFKGRQFR